MNPKYPIYIPTKNRFKSRLTIRALDNINVPYYIVIEPQEYSLYSKIASPETILILPWSKPESSTELVKARCWIKNHSISIGAKRHWQLDDNIGQSFRIGTRGFFRLNNNLKIPVASGTIFRAAEDFVDRYENIAISGFNYFMFASRKTKMPPYYLNTRIYSCSLILNEIPYEWRGIYNDDTDICLRVLKDGWCTILFNAFLCWKQQTMTVKGGNTDIYQEDGRWKMAEELRRKHPDVTTITRKWGRWQHQVNYEPFRKNKLIKNPSIVIPKGINNYGMKLIELDNELDEFIKREEIREEKEDEYLRVPIENQNQLSLF